MFRGYYWGLNPWHGYFGIPILGYLFGTAIVVLIIYLIVLIVKKLHNRETHYGGTEDGALLIAKQRYARGEISREEYELIVEDLKKLG